MANVVDVNQKRWVEFLPFVTAAYLHCAWFDELLTKLSAFRA